MQRADAIEKLKGFEPRLRALGATSLYLFGSTARDEARATSDLDLFVDLTPGTIFTLLDLAATRRMLSEALRVPIDLTTRDGFSAPVAAEIMGHAIQVF